MQRRKKRHIEEQDERENEFPNDYKEEEEGYTDNTVDDTDACPLCGSDKVELMECAECHERVKGCYACFKSIEKCACGSRSVNPLLTQAHSDLTADISRCTCGSTNIATMQCEDCGQDAKECMDCHQRLSPCACDKSRKSMVADKRESHRVSVVHSGDEVNGSDRKVFEEASSTPEPEKKHTVKRKHSAHKEKSHEGKRAANDIQKDSSDSFQNMDAPSKIDCEPEYPIAKEDTVDVVLRDMEEVVRAVASKSVVYRPPPRVSSSPIARKGVSPKQTCTLCYQDVVLCTCNANYRHRYNLENRKIPYIAPESIPSGKGIGEYDCDDETRPISVFQSNGHGVDQTQHIKVLKAELNKKAQQNFELNASLNKFTKSHEQAVSQLNEMKRELVGIKSRGQTKAGTREMRSDQLEMRGPEIYSDRTKRYTEHWDPSVGKFRSNTPQPLNTDFVNVKRSILCNDNECIPYETSRMRHGTNVVCNGDECIKWKPNQMRRETDIVWDKGSEYHPIHPIHSNNIRQQRPTNVCGTNQCIRGADVEMRAEIADARDIHRLESEQCMRQLQIANNVPELDRVTDTQLVNELDTLEQRIKMRKAARMQRQMRKMNNDPSLIGNSRLSQGNVLRL